MPLRFVNIYYQSSWNDETIWNLVRKMKVAFLSKSCKSNTGFINIDAIKSVVNSFQEQLQINTCEADNNCNYINANLTNVNLSKPAEMFLYLVSCSIDLNPWYKFYENIFEAQPPDQMVLTLNKILKSTKEKAKDLYDIAAKIFQNLDEVLVLKYKTIQNLTQGVTSLTNQKSFNKVAGKLTFIKLIIQLLTKITVLLK